MIYQHFSDGEEMDETLIKNPMWNLPNIEGPDLSHSIFFLILDSIIEQNYAIIVNKVSIILKFMQVNMNVKVSIPNSNV